MQLTGLKLIFKNIVEEGAFYDWNFLLLASL